MEPQVNARSLIWTAIKPRPRGPKPYFIRTKDGDVQIAILGIANRESVPAITLNAGNCDCFAPGYIVAYAGPIDVPGWGS